MQHQPDHSQAEGQRVIPVFIDDVKYDAPSHSMTGAALRALPQPPVGADRDLWLEVPGPRDDVLIRPEQTYDVKPGSKYYTAPSTINPGGTWDGHS
jgi:hypothetical protein